MYQFKEFDIKIESKSLEGEKIKIIKVFNLPIIVQAFKIEKSKFEKGTGKCLHLQIELDGQKRLVFTGSASLMEQIEQVDKFPFQTIIVRQHNDRFEFT